MLPLPEPVLNGVSLTHEELRLIHDQMRIAVWAATGEKAFDGPRWLFPERGEYYVLRAHRRDRDGNLLASVSVHMPWAEFEYVRRVRLVRQSRWIIGSRLG